MKRRGFLKALVGGLVAGVAALKAKAVAPTIYKEAQASMWWPLERPLTPARGFTMADNGGMAAFGAAVAPMRKAIRGTKEQVDRLKKLMDGQDELAKSTGYKMDGYFVPEGFWDQVGEERKTK